MKKAISNSIILASVSSGVHHRWFHTLPAIGEYPDKQVIYDGKEINGTIVIDKEAINSCVAAFKTLAENPDWRGILVDREHFSLMSDKPSDAMAWAKHIRVDQQGVWTKWDFTEPGQKIYDGNVLVSRSPVMELQPLGNNRFRPVAIISIAMTNTPQFETLSTFAAARMTAETQHQQGETTMKQLLELLGLPETATEEEAIAAVQALIDSQAAAEEEVETVQAEVVARRCDAFIAAHKGSISDVAKFRKTYLAAPDATEAAFGAFRAPPGSRSRIIARDAATPSRTVAQSEQPAQISARRNAAVSTYRAGNPGLSFSAAWAACRAADPALFTDPQQD